MAEKILIIDDDKDMCLVLKRFLTKHGFEAIEANSGKKALEILEGINPDLILCDFKLEDMDGTTILKNIKEKLPAVPVIIITGYSNIKTAVEVMRLGAIDYVTKPLLPDEILVTIKRALKEPQPIVTQPATPAENSYDKAAVSKKNEVNQTYIFGNSPDFKNILNQIDLVGPTNYSVIIYGESGSGKEAIAQEIHKRSKRADKPFIAIDCGALSKELAGSELFGHEKGSFTGAVGQKIGSFELANGGTILLDEIANLPYDVQVSLLRVTQERKMRRVGGTKDIDLDVRIIVASNEKLWDAARNGKFREDLYHRFNEFQINVPPLRERKNDVMIFARHFLNITNQELSKDVKGFTPEVETIFQNYVWHGNLRELKNVIKRATLLTDGDLIDVKSIPFEVSNYTKLQFDAGAEQPSSAIPSSYGMDSSGLPAAPSYTRPVIKETGLKGAGIDAEYEIILEALKRVNFNKSKAAKLLKIDRKTLYNKIKQYKELNNIEFQQEV
ncbi:MAG TPA: sigma-54 dependent transcriptional regulator [Ohtaekwangia sp.]|uniref:sigma-54-dependent transcriptional regulator n=1 Tax=Ohtaekwangia sp. TaxID=2066019 RepID=UPI002F933E8C